MFPLFRQRVLIVAATLIGGLAWLEATGFVRAADLSPGLAVIDAGSGTFLAIVMLVICGVPAMLGAWITTWTGRTPHGLGGPFVLGAALCFVAIDGGPSSGYVWRSAQAMRLPGAYGALFVETLGWAAMLVGFLWAVKRLEPILRPHLPAAFINTSDHTVSRFGYSHHGLMAGLLSAMIGGLCANVLVASTDTGQLIGGLGLSFIAAGLLARLLIGQSNPTFVLLSPALVAAFAYAWVWLGATSQPALLASWYANQLPCAAIPLPIHYFSAGLAGVAAGFGLGDSMAREREA